MKRTIMVMSTLLVFGALLAGCAGNRDLIQKASLVTRQDVFREMTSLQPVSGKALLKVEFPVKNFKARLINTYFKQTDPPYTLVLNIDGQAVVVTDDPVLEERSGSFMDDPEAGTGWRYTFRKNLLLQPGTHRVAVAVPLSDIIVEKELDLAEGVNELNLASVYNASMAKYPNHPRFSKGLRTVMVTLNNREL